MQPGPLIGVALEFLGRPPNDVRGLGPRNQTNPGTLDDRDRLRLQRFLSGVRYVHSRSCCFRPTELRYYTI
jgi:hypothetical protein